VNRMIERFQHKATGYPARLRPTLVRFKGDYDHLARHGEWQDTDIYLVEQL